MPKPRKHQALLARIRFELNVESYVSQWFILGLGDFESLYAYSVSRSLIRFPLIDPSSVRAGLQREKQTQPSFTSWATPRFDCGGWMERVATSAVMNNEIGFKIGSTRYIRGSSHMTIQPCTYRMGKWYIDSPPGGQCACMVCKNKSVNKMKFSEWPNVLVLPFKPLLSFFLFDISLFLSTISAFDI